MNIYNVFFVTKLKAPCYIEARDCEGKIRYPHFLTKSENFQLSSGSSHLSVYYVNLDSDEPTSKLMPPQKEKTKKERNRNTSTN